MRQESKPESSGRHSFHFAVHQTAKCGNQLFQRKASRRYAGIQINRLNPINKGEIVWVVNVQDVALIGRLFNEGRFDARKIVAIAGSEISKPMYYHSILGASVRDMLAGKLKTRQRNASFQATY